MAAASSRAALPKLPFGLSLLDEEPNPEEPWLRDSDIHPQDNNEQGGKGDAADGVGDGGMAAISEPLSQGATGNSASSAEPDKVYSVAPETLALLPSASSLVSPELTHVPARGARVTKMVARKSVVSGRREDPVAMVDSDLSKSTAGHYREEKHAGPSNDTEG
jgi:hypothetical protein